MPNRDYSHPRRRCRKLTAQLHSVLDHAHALYDAGEYQLAFEGYQRCLSHRELRHFSGKKPSFAVILPARGQPCEESSPLAKRTPQRHKQFDWLSISLLRHMGYCANRLGHFSEAEKFFRRALQQLPPKSVARSLLWKDIADCRYNNDDIASALHFYKVAEKIKSGRKNNQRRKRISAQYLCDIADCQRRTGRFAEARKHYQRCITLLQTSSVKDSECARSLQTRQNFLLTRTLILGDAMEGLAEILFREKDYEQARQFFEQALEAKSKVWGPADAGLRDIWFRLSHIQLLASKSTDAIPYIERLVAILRRFEPGTLTTAQFMHQLAQALAQCGRNVEAVKLLEDSSVIFQHYLLAESGERRQCLLSLANAYCWLEQYSAAEQVSRKLLEADSRQGLELLTARAQRTLGVSLAGQRKYCEAESHHRSAVELFTSIKGTNDPETISAKVHLERTLAYAERSATPH